MDSLFKSAAGILKHTGPVAGLMLLFFFGATLILTRIDKIPEAERGIVTYVCVGLMVASFLVLVLSLVVDRLASKKADPPREIRFALFIAAPMASLGKDEYREVRESILSLMRRIQASSGPLEIYFAGENCPTRDDFDFPLMALSTDWDHLRASERFLLVYPKAVDSSCLVEAGLALALEIPSVYLVKEGVDLPFMLQEAGQSFPFVQKHSYQEQKQLLNYIEKKGVQLFDLPLKEGKSA